MRQFCGWINRPAEVERFARTLPIPQVRGHISHLVGQGAGKVALLYDAVRKVWGRDLDEGPQAIGDCVSWGYSGSVDLVACVQVLNGVPQQASYDNRTCTEATYALSRCEFGQLRGSYDDGSVGAWAAAAVRKGGTLGRVQLGQYDPKRAKQWGHDGLSPELEKAALQHVVQEVSLVEHFTDARDLIASGHSLAVCSNQGFLMTRDEQGYCRPSGRWDHCMKFVAARDDGRPALLCMQSWGKDNPGGPKGDFDIPGNSFWVDADVAEGMLKQGDSFVLSGFKGYPKLAIDSWVF